MSALTFNRPPPDSSPSDWLRRLSPHFSGTASDQYSSRPFGGPPMVQAWLLCGGHPFRCWPPRTSPRGGVALLQEQGRRDADVFGRTNANRPSTRCRYSTSSRSAARSRSAHRSPSSSAVSTPGDGEYEHACTDARLRRVGPARPCATNCWPPTTEISRERREGWRRTICGSPAPAPTVRRVPRPRLPGSWGGRSG